MLELCSEYDGLVEKWATPLHTTVVTRSFIYSAAPRIWCSKKVLKLITT
jgi:hypothetical protein